MTTDFEKQFGRYGDLTDPLGLASTSMATGQYPLRPEESTGKRLVRLAGKGATFGLGQSDIEAETIPEYLAEFAGSIPSTVAATALGGMGIGAAVPAFARLGPVARNVITAGTLGTGVGAGKALKSGEITDVPSEAAWWTGGELVGQGALKLGRKYFGKGAKIGPPGVVTPEMHGPPKPTPEEFEFYKFVADQEAAKKGNIVNRIMNPQDMASTVPGEPRAREVFPSTGKRTMLPPPEIPPSLPTDGPAVRLIKIGDDKVDFDDVPDITFGKTTGFEPGARKVELYRAEGRGTTGETFTDDRIKALRDAKTVGGYLKSVEVPEGELAQYGTNGKYRIPHAKQKELGVGEHEPMDVSTYVKEVDKGAKIRPRPTRAATEMSLEDEFGRTVAGEGPMGPERPLTPGQAAQQSFSTPPDPNAIPFRLAPEGPPPSYTPIKRPTLSDHVEGAHENPAHPESIARPLKEITDPTSGVTMVVPKTQRAAQLMEAASRVTRHVEPPISPAMKTDLATPLNQAKLDHGTRSAQYRTSNLIKKDDEAIEMITKDAEGRLVVKPLQFQHIDQTATSARVAKNLDRQGITQVEMQDFIKQKTAEWDEMSASLKPGDVRVNNKKAWMKEQLFAELKRRGPC